MRRDSLVQLPQDFAHRQLMKHAANNFPSMCEFPKPTFFSDVLSLIGKRRHVRPPRTFALSKASFHDSRNNRYSPTTRPNTRPPQRQLK